MHPTEDQARTPRSEEFAYVIAGLIDLTASRATGVVRQVQGVLRRSDLGPLASGATTVTWLRSTFFSRFWYDNFVVRELRYLDMTCGYS
jgi:hypothetical protein